MLATDDQSTFLEAFQAWWFSDMDKQRLIRRSALFIGPRIYRTRYTDMTPLGLMALAAGAQGSIWLPESVRMDPLLQAFWLLSEESLLRPQEMAALDDATMQEELQKSLDDLWRDGDTLGVCTHIRSLPDGGMRDSLAPWLARRSMSDFWLMGRKFAYMMACLRLCRWTRWDGGESLIYPAIHCALQAPEDTAMAEWLATILDHNPIRQDHITGANPALRTDRLEGFIHLCQTRDPESLVSFALQTLTEGASVTALYDGLLAAGARLIQVSDPVDWEAPINAYLYVAALTDILSDLEPTAQVESLLLAALLLQQAAAALERIQESAAWWPNGEDGVVDGPEGPPFILWADLASAMDAGDTGAALPLLGRLLAGGCDNREFAAFLASYAARNDARIHSSLDMQYAHACVLTASGKPRHIRRQLLGAAVHFFCECDKDHSLWDQARQGM